VPRRLSAEDLAEVRRRIQRCLPEMEQALGRLLRRRSPLELGALSEIHAGSLFREIGAPAALVRFKSRGQVGWVELPSQNAVDAIERVLGRLRGKTDEAPAARPLTGLEQSLLVKLMRGLLLQVANALGLEIAQLEGVASYREAGSYLDAEGQPDAYRLSVELLTTGPDGPFRIALLLPLESAKSFGRASSAAAPEAVPGHLVAVPVEVSVSLGQAELSLSELLGLAPGDVIPLELARGEPARLSIDGRNVGLGDLGALAGRLAVRLSHLKLD
jgi:flagellar motor switch protein FliM